MDSKEKDITKVKLQQDFRSSSDDGETPGTSRDDSAGLAVNSADDIRNTTTSLVTKRINSEDSMEMDSQQEIETQNAKIGKNKKNDTTFDTVRIVMQLVDEDGNKKKVELMKDSEDKHDDKKSKKSPPRARERATKKRRGPRRKPAVPKKRFRYSYTKATRRTPTPGTHLYKKRQDIQLDSASDSDIASISSISSLTDSLTD